MGEVDTARYVRVISVACTAGLYLVRTSSDYIPGEGWKDTTEHDVSYGIRHHAARTSIIINEVEQ